MCSSDLGEAFVGYYHAGLSNRADACLSWDEVLEIEPGYFVCHNEPPVELQGWQRQELTINRSQALLATALAELEGLESPAQLPHSPAPIYLQRSQAEKNIDGR